ncbi:MAG: hypothetical protein M9891_12435 [Austwickia sp.]|nr:hypothetical protein [Actinomycetota bacterium]MCB1299777.1 hypothetical protein [Tetrasphaera sp.]MCO5310077.1 hypothetical protein [Austwickia sp.]
MKPRLTHFGVAATLGLAATGLVGCGSADPAAAAVVDGHVIKDADVWAVVNDLAKLPRNRDVTVGDVLPALIMAQIVQDHAVELRVPTVSPEAAIQQLEAGVPQGELPPEWNAATVKAFQDVTALSVVMNGQTQPKAVELIQKSTVTVNPKYGTFDRRGLTLAAPSPNWMVPTPTPAPAQEGPSTPQPTGNPTTLPEGPAPAPATPSPATPAAPAPAPATTTPAAPAAPAPSTSP